MSSIKSKNTRIEKLLFLLLDLKRVKYLKHYKIVGSPDVAFPRIKLAVFVHGNFWHGWNFSALKKKLKNNYWKDKIKNNIRRDARNIKILRQMGWNVIRVWEHQILRDPTGVINRIITRVKKR